MELKNKEYINVIDSKQLQQVFDVDNTQNSKGFLYEFNFKSTNNLLTEANVDEYINNFDENISSFVKGKQCIIHITGLMSDSGQTDLTKFKLLIGLTVRRTLSEVEFEVEKANSVFFTEGGISLLNKRIVNNKSKVSSEKYMDCFNEYLEKEHPLYLRKQKILN